MNLSRRELALRTDIESFGKNSVFFRGYTMNYESDIACGAAQGNSILECWVPSGGGAPSWRPLGEGDWCGEELFSIENVNISPASISDLVSPGII